MPLPEDVIARYADGSKSMAVTGFDVEVVRKTSDGAETKVGLKDHYLHHYIFHGSDFNPGEDFGAQGRGQDVCPHAELSCHDRRASSQLLDTAELTAWRRQGCGITRFFFGVVVFFFSLFFEGWGGGITVILLRICPFKLGTSPWEAFFLYD